jgi:hypothetical protein
MFYHQHGPARLKFTLFTTLEEIEVERIDPRNLFEGGILINGMPVAAVKAYPDGSVTVYARSRFNNERIPYPLHGSQFWQIMHGDEEPNIEYTGQLEGMRATMRSLILHRKSKDVETLLKELRDLTLYCNQEDALYDIEG